MNLQATMLSPIPRTYRSALVDSNWRDTMQEEFTALQANKTWDLAPPPPGTNIVTRKWIFRHKLHLDGSLERYNARWVLRGFTQRPGIDFSETFSPVVKGNHPYSSIYGSISELAHQSVRREECFSSWHFGRDSLLCSTF